MYIFIKLHGENLLGNNSGEAGTQRNLEKLSNAVEKNEFYN